MRRKNYLIWLSLTLAIFFSASLGCFSAAFFDRPEENRIFHTHQLNQDDRSVTIWRDQKLIRDYRRMSDQIDESIKKSLEKNKIAGENLIQIEEISKSEPITGELVSQISWVYRQLNALADEKANLPEIVLNLQSALKAAGAQVKDTIWEENNDVRFARLKIGFPVNAKFLLTHDLEIKQTIKKQVLNPVQTGEKLAVIIDDWGAMSKGTKEMLALPYPITAAVLPNRPYTGKEVKLVLDSGKQAILHMPLEPLAKGVNAGQEVIKSGMKPEEIKRIFNNALSQTPGVIGTNNHMGSKASQDRAAVKAWLEEVKKNNLFVIDSMTSEKSVIGAVAKELGIPYGENILFLDNVDQAAAVKKQLLEAGKRVKQRGKGIVIGHVRLNTAKALAETLPELEKQGIKIVFVSELLKNE